MTFYKDIKQVIYPQTNLVHFESEIGVIVDSVKKPSNLHIDTFVKGQEIELEQFCALHNIRETYSIIITQWGA